MLLRDLCGCSFPFCFCLCIFFLLLCDSVMVTDYCFLWFLFHLRCFSVLSCWIGLRFCGFGVLFGSWVSPPSGCLCSKEDVFFCLLLSKHARFLSILGNFWSRVCYRQSVTTVASLTLLLLLFRHKSPTGKKFRPFGMISWRGRYVRTILHFKSEFRVATTWNLWRENRELMMQYKYQLPGTF